MLARIVTHSQKRDHIMLLLKGLHWLLLAERIDYKFALVPFNVDKTQEPSYLHKLLRVHVTMRVIRSNEQVIACFHLDHQLPAALSVAQLQQC